MDKPEVSGLQRLWAPVQPPGREARAGLTPDRIIRAAIELADEGGLDGVSMNRVAKRLGFTPMSLYRHVGNKDDLLLLMHDTAWQVPADLDEPSGGWRPAVERWCRAQQAVLRQHPWLEQIRVTERMGTPSQLAWLDRGLRTLADTPLSEYEKTQVLQLLGGHVSWDARVMADLLAAAPGGDEAVAEMTADFGALVRTVADPGRFPALRRAVDAGVFDARQAWHEAALTDDFDPIFRFGLDVILDGVEQLIARRRVAASGPPPPSGT